MSKNLLVKFLSFIFQTVNLKSKIEKLALFFVVDVELKKNYIVVSGSALNHSGSATLFVILYPSELEKGLNFSTGSCF